MLGPDTWLEPQVDPARGPGQRRAPTSCLVQPGPKTDFIGLVYFHNAIKAIQHIQEVFSNEAIDMFYK